MLLLPAPPIFTTISVSITPTVIVVVISVLLAAITQVWMQKQDETKRGRFCRMKTQLSVHRHTLIHTHARGHGHLEHTCAQISRTHVITMPGRDLVLILDVARFKYPPHWVRLRLCQTCLELSFIHSRTGKVVDASQGLCSTRQSHQAKSRCVGI